MNRRIAACLAALPPLLLGGGIAALVTAVPSAGATTWTCVSTTPGQNCPATGDWSSLLSAGSQRQQVAVLQDEFGNSANHSQELDANSPSQWQAIANVAAGNTSVTSYPDAQDQLDSYDGSRTPAVLPMPVSQYTSLKSTFSVTMPASPGATDDYEAAYDLWLGDASTSSYANDQEVMVWTDNHGQTPAGSDSGTTWTDASTGAVYEAWVNPGSNTASSKYQTISLVAKANVTSGSVDLLAMLNWLEAQGYSTANLGIDQVDYGFEVCSTSGALETFAVNGYTLDGSTGPAPTPTGTPTSTPTPTPTPTAAPGGLSQTPHEYVNFGWQAVPGWSGGYEFQLETTNGTIVADETVSGLSAQQVAVAKDTGYKWRVSATGGPWSAFRSFTSP